MTNEQFRDLLDGYGPDLTRWPDRDRVAAQDLLRADIAARAALDEAVALDRLLADTLGRGTATATLRARLASIPLEHRRAARSGRWLEAVWQPWRIGMAAATASAILGLVIGIATAPPPPDEPSLRDAAALVYGFDEEELS